MDTDKWLFFCLTAAVSAIVAMSAWIIVHNQGSLARALASTLLEETATASADEFRLIDVGSKEQPVVDEALADILTMMAQNEDDYRRAREREAGAVVEEMTLQAASVVTQTVAVVPPPPVFPPAPPSIEVCVDRTYTVTARGDSLWKIASAHYEGKGNFYPLIAQRNKIKPPYRIHLGDTLVIPGCVPQKTSPTPPVVVTVPQTAPDVPPATATPHVARRQSVTPSPVVVAAMVVTQRGTTIAVNRELSEAVTLGLRRLNPVNQLVVARQRASYTAVVTKRGQPLCKQGSRKTPSKSAKFTRHSLPKGDVM